MKKNILVLVIGAFTFGAQAQDSIPKQTISTADISAHLQLFNVNSEILDSNVMRAGRGQSLGQMLASEGWGNLSLYGPPGTSVQARIAGLSADHTAVNWNGIPMDSPTLGSTDLSLIPVFLLSTITLSDGGAFNQGSSFGGSVHLNSQEVIKQSGAALFAEYSSLGNLQGGAKGQYRLGKFFGKTGVQYGQFTNEFKVVLNDVALWQENNDVDQLAVSQDLAFEINEKHKLYASALWVNRDAQVPFQRNSFGLVAQDQSDSTMKIAAGWKYVGTRIKTDVKWGSAVESQNYNYSYTWDGEVFGEISQIRTAKNLVDASAVYYATDGLKVAGGVRAQDIRAKTSNFIENQQAQIGNVYAMAEWKNKVLDAQVNGRYDQNSHADNGSAFDVILSKKLTKKSVAFVPQIVVSKKFRAPDFNELYWYPGGNPDLKSETGWSYSGGLKVIIQKEAQISISSNYTHMDIENMIQWVPDGWIWTVQNFNAAAIDWVKSEIEVKRGNHAVSLRHEFSENVFTGDDGTVGRTLYVPKHQFIGSLMAHVASVDLKLSLLVRDRVTVQPDDLLSGRTEFTMLNLSAARAFEVASSTFDLTIGIDNILDQQMEFIQFAPMPGRVFRVGIFWTMRPS